MPDSNVDSSHTSRIFWMLLWVAFLIILFWFITVIHPSWFWGLMNILLWISLILSWIAAIISAFNNQHSQYVWMLFTVWVLIFILWIVLICSSEENFIGRLMIWMFALWALMRWWMLIFFGIQSKENNPFWWWISLLWLVLVILAIMTAVASWSAANFVAICIWISIVIDWFSLLFFAFRFKSDPSLQAQLISQVHQDEIAQWDVVITQTEISVNMPDNKPENS